MFVNKQKIITAALAAVAVVALITQIGASGFGQKELARERPGMARVPVYAAGLGEGEFKLEGAWVARVTSIDPPIPLFPYQWSYVLAPDASGRRAALYGSVDVGFPTDDPDGSRLPLIGELVQTGPDTFAFNSYFYSIQKGIPIAQIVLIGRSYGEGKFTGPGKAEGTHHFEWYLASADADGDGLPDPGSVPVVTFNATTSDTRIPSPLL